MKLFQKLTFILFYVFCFSMSSTMCTWDSDKESDGMFVRSRKIVKTTTCRLCSVYPSVCLSLCRKSFFLLSLFQVKVQCSPSSYLQMIVRKLPFPRTKEDVCSPASYHPLQMLSHHAILKKLTGNLSAFLSVDWAIDLSTYLSIYHINQLIYVSCILTVYLYWLNGWLISVSKQYIWRGTSTKFSLSFIPLSSSFIQTQTHPH